MKPCFEFQQWRRKVQAGSATPADEARWMEHCSQCPECDRAWEAERTLNQALQGMATVKAPEGFNQHVWDRIQALPTPAVQASSRTWGWGWAAVAALLVLAVASVVYMTQHQGSESSVQVAHRATPVPGLETTPVPQTAPERLQLNPVVQHSPRLKKDLSEPAVPFEPEKNVPRLARKPEGRSVAPVQAVLPPLGQKRAESLAPAQKGSGLSGSERGVSEKQPAENAAVGTPGVLAGTVRVRPNKINLNRQEKVILEINPEQPGRLEARIYTREGTGVKTLVDAQVSPGYQSWEWNGTNDRGERVAAGIYILLVQGLGREERFKLAVVR